jgi:hypothetical protein
MAEVGALVGGRFSPLEIVRILFLLIFLQHDGELVTAFRYFDRLKSAFLRPRGVVTEQSVAGCLSVPYQAAQHA